MSVIEVDARSIPLTRGFTAWVSAMDYDAVSRSKWHIIALPRTKGRFTYYAASCSSIAVGHVRLHRYILGLTDRSFIVDHLDRDGLNCTRSNLEIKSNAANQQNRVTTSATGFKGVQRWAYRNATQVKFYACIHTKGHSEHLGSFLTPEEAAMAHDKRAREIYGAQACVNFPRLGELSARE